MQSGGRVCQVFWILLLGVAYSEAVLGSDCFWVLSVRSVLITVYSMQKHTHEYKFENHLRCLFSCGVRWMFDEIAKENKQFWGWKKNTSAAFVNPQSRHEHGWEMMIIVDYYRYLKERKGNGRERFQACAHHGSLRWNWSVFFQRRRPPLKT